MKDYFFNRNENRLRSGWRIFVFFVVLMGLSSVFLALLKVVLGGLPEARTVRDYAAILLAAIAASTVVPLARRFLDKKSLVSLGLQVDTKSVKDLAFGFFLSGVMAASIFAIMNASGLIEISKLGFGDSAPANNQPFSLASYLAVASLGSLALHFMMTVIIGWWEELVFRGYLLQNMIDGLGVRIAVVLSCIIYGLVHAANPHAGMLSSGIIVLFGFLRLYGYLATKLLWLSIGMHTGWNFFQGPIFGFAASGHETASLIEHTSKGPDWLTGGEFGPESSLMTIPVIGLALIVMRWWAKKTTP